ncbi:MAG TPA: DUF4440 domain-containing protein [Luteimonas sp.]|nr:DUF4440 domain-containing protein [Luteimonas sp.]
MTAARLLIHCAAAWLAALPIPAAFAAESQASAPRLSAAECEVWARELSFARSVADHDPVAFAAHLHPGAVFGAKSPQPQRGRDDIARAWQGIVEGKRVKLSWYPTMVAIGGEGDIAYSSGPALYESLVPDAKQRYSIGGFQSIWHKDADGVWRVLFDDGVQPVPASDAQVEGFRKGRLEVCPKV